MGHPHVTSWQTGSLKTWTRTFPGVCVGTWCLPQAQTPKHIKSRVLKSMKHRQLSDCLFFTTGIFQKKESRKRKRERERQWQLPDGPNEAHPVHVYQVNSPTPPPTPLVPRSALFVWLSEVNGTVSLAPAGQWGAWRRGGQSPLPSESQTVYLIVWQQQ